MKPVKVDPTPVVVKEYKDGSIRYHSEACPKCGGVGYLRGYEFIDGARCWKCNATGHYPHEWVEKSEERINKEREKNKQKLMSQADDKNRYFLKSHGFNENGKSYVVMGDTYSIKDELKSIGGKFDYILGWKIPNDSEKYKTIEIDISDVANKDENGWYVYKPMSELQDFIDKKKKEYKDAHTVTNPDDNISEYIIGEIGDKIKVDATLKSVYDYETHFSYYGGISTIYKFVMDNGNIIIWNTSGVASFNDRPIEEGNKYTITGTIKNFKEYKGEKETVLTRCKIVDKVNSTNESFESEDGEYIIKDGIKYASYHNDFLDAHQGEYLADGSYVPALNPLNGHLLMPKEIWDMWD